MTKISTKYGSYDFNCGYEMDCRKKDCVNCRRRFNLKKPVTLTHAEAIAIEDFGTCDLQAMIGEKPDEVELLQKIMLKLMMKIYRLEIIKK